MNKFLLFLTIAIVTSVIVTMQGYSTAGSVWDTHAIDGVSLLNFHTPEIPAFPMWGYSVLAALGGKSIPIFEGIFLFCILAIWNSMITKSNNEIGLNISGTLWPLSFVIILIPYIFVSVSYYSNSFFGMLILLGAVFLQKANKINSHLHWTILSSLAFGTAYNIRNEAILFCLAFIFALFLHRLIQKKKLFSISRITVFVLLTLVSIGPWYWYTGHVLAAPRLGTTNSGGVMYLSLGIRPDNPWNIEFSDEFVGNIALQKNFGSPWSETADKYFTMKTVDAVKAHPDAFAKKILTNLKLQILQGTYVPNMRSIFGSELDKQRLDYVNELFKGKIGLTVNESELQTYLNNPDIFDEVTPAHFAIVLTEYAFRAGYALLFLMLIALSLALTVLSRFRYLESWLFLAATGSTVLISSLFLTLPRMSTIILPFALWCSVTIYTDIRRSTRRIK
ncbi:hypothetical protein [Granulosicoccus antarcticus]|uniref:Glycosyltransferase RgtA/B/C/D-like domain-containing protein n=1 Tax=Granulosicoccus antarcticus IMCC3135 TaxID=1192854 RepID=A0A2Z2NT92_9GAMM|nr:hypothetical protein [Granulosicoccus antarcticus]ASJ74493.1 hypothetical protein IMCC3135_22110 [Granulosicoccus antarcticus IMCC3135]